MHNAILILNSIYQIDCMVLRKNKARAQTGNLFANMDNRLRKKYNGTELFFYN